MSTEEQKPISDEFLPISEKLGQESSRRLFSATGQNVMLEAARIDANGKEKSRSFHINSQS